MKHAKLVLVCLQPARAYFFVPATNERGEAVLQYIRKCREAGDFGSIDEKTCMEALYVWFTEKRAPTQEFLTDVIAGEWQLDSKMPAGECRLEHVQMFDEQ